MAIRGLGGASAVTLALLAGACADRSNDKQDLTPEILAQIAQSCGATDARLYPQGSGWPNVGFRFTDTAPAPDKPTPTVKCMGKRLEGYRYGYMMLDPAGATMR
ncbi:hypothetical protein KY084_01850 [Stakelama sp. CBK3Z-3]|uniref:Lipoprotein n=1 Tax=Stakelama flava TaxID=2860338 RepID=A0ABS6XHD1_9SPHN|nr:hypothetical protein [Stakelama flava]MBW4329618.1 hypothetical protein [Stakelama flava]